MQSALGNAAARLRVRTAFIVTADGRVSAIDPSVGKQQAAALWEPLDEGRLTGVSVLAGRPRQLVAAPIMAPTLLGWVVFAADLDAREMRALELLSAIPLHAAVLANGNGRWSEAAGSMSVLSGDSARLAEDHVQRSSAFEMRVGGATSIALAKPLAGFRRRRTRNPSARLPQGRSARRCAQIAARARRHDVARPPPGRLRDVARGGANYAAARSPRRGRRPAGLGRACSGAGARRRRAGAAGDELQRNGRQDRRARATDHAAGVQRRAHRSAEPHHVPAAARTFVPRG